MFAHRLKAALAATLTLTSVLAAFSPAQAARVDARQLTCQQARALVQQSGAVVMSFTNTAYDRVVRNRVFCDHGLITKPKFTQTLDNPRCHVGGICIDDPWKDTMRFLMRRN
ncbi:hypothetical protein [Salaquimonas pukyongi]|uniref:hypothetical protein n=1 Tax=Salaquimonas pukyongi TaxID=2712698 RepID=UPI00096B9C58|nr:hypothetical protein [Salaquimonas pukyongi]